MPSCSPEHHHHATKYEASTTRGNIYLLLPIPSYADPLQVSVTTNNAPCNGAQGSAQALPSGGTLPYSVTFRSTSGTTYQTSAPLPAGTYDVLVSDAYNCPLAPTQFTITQPGIKQGYLKYICRKLPLSRTPRNSCKFRISRISTISRNIKKPWRRAFVDLSSRSSIYRSIATHCNCS